MSMKNELCTAEDTKTLTKLLEAGESYVYATEKTKRQWGRVADKRKKELKA